MTIKRLQRLAQVIQVDPAFLPLRGLADNAAVLGGGWSGTCSPRRLRSPRATSVVLIHG